MMKKKILSALTALCCAVGCMGSLYSFAEETLPSQEYIVVAVDSEETPEKFVIMNPDDPGTYLWLSATDIDRFLAEGEESIEFGDILLLEGDMIWTGREGINSFYFVDENGETTDDAGCIYNTGSVLDGSTETFTVTTYENASYDSLGEHKCYFNYIYSDGCIQPGCVDWSTVESGDSVTCITYNGVPVLPVAVNAETTLPTEEFIVIGVDNEEDPGVFIIMSMENKSHILRLPIRYTEQFMPEGEDPVEFGDILTLEGYLGCTEEVGLNTFCFVDIDDIDNDGDLQEQIGYIYNTGSVLNNETAVFTAGEIYGGVYRYLDDYWYYMMEDGFTQPGCIDLSTVSTGDSVTCITYNGVPVLPVAVNAETTSPITDDTYVVSDIIQYSDGDAVYLLKGFSNRYHGLEPGYDIVFSASFISTLADIPQIGDLIQLEGEYVRLENPIPRLQRMSEDFTVSVVGDAAEYLESETFTVINDVDEINIEYADYYTLYDAEGTQISYAYMTYESFIPENTEVEFLMYDGKPVLPLSVTHLGDFNTDGEINAMDATRILMAAAAAGAGTEALSTASETAASPVGDVNSDGEVNAMDATIVLVYAARNGAGEQISVSEVATELME